MGLGAPQNLNALLASIGTENGAWRLVETVTEDVLQSTRASDTKLHALRVARSVPEAKLEHALSLSRDIHTVLDSFDVSNPAHRTPEFAAAWVADVDRAVRKYNDYVARLGDPRIVKSTESTALRTFFWSLGAIGIALGLGYVLVRNMRR